LWLALRFPALPVDILTRGDLAPGPLAVAERQGKRARVAACNAAAIARGVRPGMAVTAARMLAAELVVRDRDPRAEDAALSGLAAWAGRFTPAVSLQPPDGLLLEVGSCLRLHHGLDRLLEQLLADLQDTGYTAAHACAPTPHGAWLLARFGTGTCVGDSARLPQSLAALPIALLDQAAYVLEGLERIGVQTLGDCLRLPRAGLVRRFGRGLADELERALGRLPEPRVYFVPPPDFVRVLELPAPVHEAESLMFAVRRLLPELEGYLSLRQAAVQEIELVCRHEEVPETVLRLGFVQPTSAADRMLLLLRETLGRTLLTAPVQSMALHARRILPLAPRSDDLFQALVPEGDGNLLLERLRIRLGEGAVYGIAPAADHRPELAWQPCAPGETALDKASTLPPKIRRPLWLLSSPLPCRDRRLRLRLQAGPERIESGWWDGMEMARDYYVAQDRYGARLWVYCERASGEWFVHGLFA
jgi:protein ImuB